MINVQRWYFPLLVLLSTGLSVFVLPFLLPPPYLAGISAANVAGFNNKVASLAAAALGTLVFFVALKRPPEQMETNKADFGRLPTWLVVLTVIVCGCIVGVLSYLVAISGQDYGDGRYFIHQISMHTVYGRLLYDQIELPYGPLLFYGPVVAHAFLSSLQASVAAAYYTTLVVEHMLGLLLVAYVLDGLPILSKWKIVFLLLCLSHTYPFGFGLNYTFLRFVLPIAFLVLAARQTGPLASATCLFAGQAASLALSPEMGFAFGAGSIAYAGYFLWREGRKWLVAVAAPLFATAAFLLLAGAGYLRMLRLFARGIANFVVEPTPYVLVFLFALVWLVPLVLAKFFRQGRREAPMLGALYIFSVALLPVAFGRADPGHVFFNGIGIYLLSLVAISALRPYQQLLWVTCVVLILTWTAFVDDRFYWPVLRARVNYDVTHWHDHALMRAGHAVAQRLPSAAENHLFPSENLDSQGIEPFDLSRLQEIVGKASVVVPLTLPVPVERALMKSGQFVPTFYDREWSILDASAEDRQIKEMNAASWALLPKGPIGLFTETQDSIAPYLGHRLPYRSPYPLKREPYVIGRRFQENLEKNWRSYAQVEGYEIYQRRD